MIAVIEDAAQVLARVRQPDHFTQWNTLPNAGTERTANVQAGHRFGEANGARFTKSDQRGEIERGAVAFGEWMPNLRRVLRIGHHFELPSVWR